MISPGESEQEWTFNHYFILVRGRSIHFVMENGDGECNEKGAKINF
jgi:hypothetical protein